jgi:hypothetical protein
MNDKKDCTTCGIRRPLPKNCVKCVDYHGKAYPYWRPKKKLGAEKVFADSYQQIITNEKRKAEQ